LSYFIRKEGSALEVRVETIKILIVDRYKSTSLAFKKILQKKGFEVDESDDSKKALEKMKTDCYDAVLISLEKPDADGKDLLFFAKRNLPNATRLVTIGFPSLEKSIKALESGADAVFSKPISPEQLITVIKKITRK
jgi:two-component system response regulator TctD